SCSHYVFCPLPLPPPCTPLFPYPTLFRSVLVLRRDRPAHPHFRVPLVLPIGGLVSCVLLMTQVERAVWRLGLPFLAVAALLAGRSEEHTSELQSRFDLVCRLLLEKKNDNT